MLLANLLVNLLNSFLSHGISFAYAGKLDSSGSLLNPASFSNSFNISFPGV
jgi:hypothetical protein